MQFFWARNAIYHGLRLLGIPTHSKVLIPAYLCRAAIEPIEAAGVRPVFYAVHRDCTPDLGDLESRIDNSTSAVMAVHYFGLPRAFQQLRELCDGRSLLLLEDCAHVLQIGAIQQPLGTFGQASVFSWRKFLPVYDGGELLLNVDSRGSVRVDSQRESLLFTLKVAKNLLEEMLPQRTRGATALREWHPIAGGASSTSSAQVSPLYLDRNSSEFAAEYVNLRMSRISRLLFRHFSLADVASKRVRNYRSLRERLSDIDGVRGLDEALPPDIVPWMFPVFIGESAGALQKLRSLGIPAVSWCGVRHPRFCSREFPDAHFLYENLIFLPVHQDLSEKDLDLIAEAVKKVRSPAPSTVSGVDSQGG